MDRVVAHLSESLKELDYVWGSLVSKSYAFDSPYSFQSADETDSFFAIEAGVLSFSIAPDTRSLFCLSQQKFKGSEYLTTTVCRGEEKLGPLRSSIK
jgi:hypothetical protein